MKKATVAIALATGVAFVMIGAVYVAANIIYEMGLLPDEDDRNYLWPET